MNDLKTILIKNFNTVIFDLSTLLLAKRTECDKESTVALILEIEELRKQIEFYKAALEVTKGGVS